MKNRLIIAAVAAVVCSAGAFSVPFIPMTGIAENVQGYAEQTGGLDSIMAVINSYIADNNITGKTYTFIKNGNNAVCVDVEKDSDALSLKDFIETQGMDKEFISLFSRESDKDFLLEKGETIVNVALYISNYMTENNIEGYVYQKNGGGDLGIVCKTEEGISQVKAYAKESGFDADRLDYSLPDFDVQYSGQLSDDIEEQFCVIDDFIRKNDINGYTEIRERKGEDKIWVVLFDGMIPEYTEKIKYFISQCGIDMERVIIDTIAYNAGDLNGDGSFGISDAVQLQKCLLAVPDVHIDNWRNADFNRNNRLDILDFVLMKRELIKQQNAASTEQQSTVASDDGFDSGASEIAEFDLNEIIKIRTDYNPAMSNWSGIGILLEFDSKDYSISLRTNDGHFTTWDIAKGSGPVKNAGMTYDIGNSGYIFWTPEEFCYPEGFEGIITVEGNGNGRKVKLGEIAVRQRDDRGIFSASIK